jgi:hypothetical protein
VRERRQRWEAACDCLECGEQVKLIAQTEVWHQSAVDVGVWEHAEYGLPQGFCCGLLYASDFEGISVYDLKEKGPDDDGREENEGASLHLPES